MKPKKPLARLGKLLRSEGMGGVLLRGASGGLGIKLTGVGLGFILHVALARSLGTEEYGVYVYAMTILNLLLIPCLLGLDTAIVRFAAAYRGQGDWSGLKGIMRRSSQLSFIVSMSVGAAVALTVYALGGAMGAELRWTLLIGSALLPLLAQTSLRQSSLRAFKRIIPARLPDPVIRPALLSIAVVGIVYVGGRRLSSPEVMTLNVMAAGITFVLASVLLRRAKPETLRSVQPDYRTQEWIRTALPLLFVSGLYLLLGRVDRLMIGIIRGAGEVGLYSVAARTSTLVLFGIQAVNLIAAPMIAEYHASKTTADLQRLVSQVARMIFWSSVPLFLGVVLFGRWFLGLFGEDFQSSYPALLFLSFGLAVNASTGPVGFLLTMTGHERTSLRIVGFSLAVNVALNIPAIYFFGVTGAAAATGFANAMRNLLTWHFSKLLLKVDCSVWGLLKKDRTPPAPEADGSVP